MFKSGDKVSVLNENAEGVVLRVLPDGRVEVDIDGFDYTYQPQELVHQDVRKQEEYFKMHAETKPEDIPTIDQRPVKLEHIKDKKKRVIDLHAGDLVATTRGWSNSDILQMQLDVFEKQLYRAMQDGIDSIVFVHGVGEGVLRQAVRDYLMQVPGVEVMDADYRKFGFGATEVILR